MKEDLREIFNAFAGIADSAQEKRAKLTPEMLPDLLTLLKNAGYQSDILQAWIDDFNADTDTNGIVTTSNIVNALCDDGKKSFSLADGWQVNSLGHIVKEIECGSGKNRRPVQVIASTCPVWTDLRIIADYTDSDGRTIQVERYRFRWDAHSAPIDLDTDSWKPEPHYIILSAGDALDSRKAQKAFSDAGLFMDSKRASSFVEMLRGLLAGSSSTIKTVREVSQLGWYINNAALCFSPYSMNNIIYRDTEDALFKAISSSRGELEEWIQLVKPYRNNKRVRTAMAAAFASPLVYLLHAQNFILDIYGTTGRGKTVLLRMCASIYGNPDGYVSSFNKTANNALTCAATLQHLPFMLDEMETINAREGFQALVYNLVNGETRGGNRKDNTARKQLTFSNVTICNGEHLGLDQGARGGALNRVLQLDIGDTPVFESPERAAHVSRQLTALHGVAGRKWISAIIKGHAAGRVDELKKRADELTQKIKSVCLCEGRQAAAAALLLIADEISSKIIFDETDSMLTAEDMLAYTTPESDTVDSTRCWEWVQEWCYTKRNNFDNKHENDDRMEHTVVSQDVYGLIEGGRAYIYKNILTKAAKDAGFILDNTILREWKESGKLLTDSEAGRYTKLKRFNNKIVRMYCINLDAAEARQIEMQVENNITLPF